MRYPSIQLGTAKILASTLGVDMKKVIQPSEIFPDGNHLVDRRLNDPQEKRAHMGQGMRVLGKTLGLRRRRGLGL